MTSSLMTRARTVPDRPRWVDWLVLIALGSIAVTQPVLSAFRAGAGYFVARRAQPAEIVLMTVVLTVLPGLLANLIVWAAEGFSERARSTAHMVCVGIFLALTTHTALTRTTPLYWVWALVVSVPVGVLASLLLRRSTWGRTFLTYLIPAPLVFAAFFLFTPPVSGLIFPPDRTAVETPIDSRVPVVFVVFDEFPVVSLLNAAGGIDASRYPNFARLASMSTWYKYTASAHDNTLWALPALLTGQTPDTSLLPTAANYPGNLFTLLQPAYELHVIEPFTHLCPPELCGLSDPLSFGDRFGSLIADSMMLYALMLNPSSELSGPVTDPFNEFTPGDARRVAEEEFATDQVDRFDEFVDGITSSQPTLHFLHSFLPHAPYRYYQSGRQYNDGEELEGLDSEVWIEPVLANQAYQRHLLQVQAVDRMIGELLTRLESRGLLEEALLVVTADHGISFRSGEARRPLTTRNAYEIGLVPLFVKSPHQGRGQVETTPVRATDVLPTVAAHLGLDIPWAHQGRSLLERPIQPAPLVVRASVGETEVSLDDTAQGMRDAIAHVHSVFGRDGGRLELYALGGYDSLVGAETVELNAGSSTLTARVDEEWRLAHVAPYTGFVPGFIHGHLFGDIHGETRVAIALNGVVETVVEVYDVSSDRARFNAILPDRAFAAGFNDLEVFAVTGAAASPQVARVNLEGNRSYEMERAASGRVTRILDSRGGSWPVLDDSPIVGSIADATWRNSDVAASRSKDLELEGWAVDVVSPTPAVRVVFFINGVFAGSSGVDVERPDIRGAYETDGVLVSGFVGRLPQFLPSTNLEIRAFALSDGYAEELPMAPSASADLSSG